MSRFGTALLATLCLLLPGSARAVEFDGVVSVGDSLLDQILNYRGPLLSEHLADRLNAPLTQLARAGSTSASLIRSGQHTQAAAQFGSGDLATLWIGGNDFFLSIANPLGVGMGNYRFMNRLEDNVDTILGTLRGAGMEVLVFNLPDMADVPLTEAVTFTNRRARHIAAATVEWNGRLADLATEYGAHLVDVYSYFEEVSANPQEHTILGRELDFDKIGRTMSVFADPIHPSSVAQGLLANLAIEVLNEAFPEGPQLVPLSELELAELAGIAPAESVAALAVVQGAGSADEAAARLDGKAFLAWQRGLDGGNPVRGLAAMQVPEPSAGLLTVVSVLGCLVGRGGGRRGGRQHGR